MLENYGLYAFVPLVLQLFGQKYMSHAVSKPTK